MAANLEEPLHAFWKNPGAGEDTAETPAMRVDIEKYRMKYRAYRLGYSKTYEQASNIQDSSPLDKKEIVCEPIDAPLFNHLSDAKRNEIDKYRADYRKYRLGYASGARGEVADLFRRQLSTEARCVPVEGMQKTSKRCIKCMNGI
ncbi:unnamed protein product [Cladocopium goreaui]|uniref:2-deoxy-scyllo-inosose synthase n=1 Tax=Cladocopium goreaui TaxID=2562237 RepID=A0A9P1FMQ0_9DINO|nr:unnamed protein product [Cladocopium goreaui]